MTGLADSSSRADVATGTPPRYVEPTGPGESGSVAQMLLRCTSLATGLVCDSLERPCQLPGAVALTRSVQLGQAVMVGRAFTVATSAGDNAAVREAVELLEPGHVLVVDAKGAVDRAVVGEIMSAHATARGASGIVVDGAVRDLAALSAGDLPVFALAVTPQGPTRSARGAIGGTIVVRGRTVAFGDLVVGDADGVVVVPWALAPGIIALAEARRDAEVQTLRRIRQGRRPAAALPAASGTV